MDDPIELTPFDMLKFWRQADMETRRTLLMQIGFIERRWGLGPFQDRGPEIVRLLDTGGTAEIGG